MEFIDLDKCQTVQGIVDLLRGAMSRNGMVMLLIGGEPVCVGVSPSQTKQMLATSVAINWANHPEQLDKLLERLQTEKPVKWESDETYDPTAKSP